MPVLRVNSASGLVEGALRGLALLNCGRTCTAEGEQVVSTKAVRTHCHSVPKSGSDTTRGRPTTMAAPAATVTTATIASVLDLCPINVTLSFVFLMWIVRLAKRRPRRRVHPCKHGAMERLSIVPYVRRS